MLAINSIVHAEALAIKDLCTLCVRSLRKHVARHIACGDGVHYYCLRERERVQTLLEAYDRWQRTVLRNPQLLREAG